MDDMDVTSSVDVTRSSRARLWGVELGRRQVRDVLLEAVDEHAWQQGALRGHGAAGPVVHGVQVGYDGGAVRGVGRPVRVGLQHPLYRRVVTGLRQQL